MRRTVLLLAATSVALILGASVAMAAAFSGTQGNDTLRGTNRIDQIYGLNGNDSLYGFQGDDELYGGAGRDNVFGGPGADNLHGGFGIDDLFGGDGRDFIDSADRDGPDTVNCGRNDGAFDRVIADDEDGIANCQGDSVTTY